MVSGWWLVVSVSDSVSSSSSRRRRRRRSSCSCISISSSRRGRDGDADDDEDDCSQDKKQQPEIHHACHYDDPQNDARYKKDSPAPNSSSGSARPQHRSARAGAESREAKLIDYVLFSLGRG